MLPQQKSLRTATTPIAVKNQRDGTYTFVSHRLRQINTAGYWAYLRACTTPAEPQLSSGNWLHLQLTHIERHSSQLHDSDFVKKPNQDTSKGTTNQPLPALTAQLCPWKLRSSGLCFKILWVQYHLDHKECLFQSYHISSLVFLHSLQFNLL